MSSRTLIAALLCASAGLTDTPAQAGPMVEEPVLIIQYRPGHGAQAIKLRSQLRLNAPLVKTPGLKPGIDVRILGPRDYLSAPGAVKQVRLLRDG